MASAPGKVVRGVRVPTSPGVRPKRRVLKVMTPEALKLFAYRFYRLGVNDTGVGFHGETFKNKRLTQQNLKAIAGILNARFNRAYSTHEEP